MITVGPTCYPIVAETPSGKLRYKTISIGRIVYNLTGVVNNILDTRPQNGYSDNVVGKIDWNINSKQTLSARAFIGSGRQLGNAGVNVYEYYQLAPTHSHNYMVTHNWMMSDHLSNQLLFGVNYFGQTFNDNVHNQNIPALGLNTGVC